MRILIGLLLLWPMLAWAQAPAPVVADDCAALTWQANMEPDLAGYSVYVTENGTALLPKAVPPTETEIACTALGMTPDHLYVIHMTATDLAGNESLASDAVTFHWGDIPPVAPQQICLTVTVDGQPVTLCGTP